MKKKHAITRGPCDVYEYTLVVAAEHEIREREPKVLALDKNEQNCHGHKIQRTYTSEGESDCAIWVAWEG